MKRFVLILTIVTLATPTMGQVVYTGPAVMSMSDLHGLVTPVPGGEPAATDTAGGFTLTGDINIDLEGLTIGSDVSVGFIVRRPFTVGPLPVLADTRMDVDLKFVNGLGSETEPITTVGAQIIVRDLVTNNHIFELEAHKEEELIGNGIAFMNGSPSAGPWVLSPGRDYTLDLFFSVSPDFLSVDPAPPTTVTVEFGGVTSFAGLEAPLTAPVVPEPATLGLLLLGSLALLKWRK